MRLPLPRVIADIGPGGALVTAAEGTNQLANHRILRKINEIKAQYMPITSQAEAASKLAYANLMGPQFLAKLMGNEGALGNLNEEQKRNILSTVYNTGTGLSNRGNVFSTMGAPQPGFGEQLGNKISDFFTNKLKNIFDGRENPTIQNNNAFNRSSIVPEQPNIPSPTQVTTLSEPSDEIDHDLDTGYLYWQNTPEGQAELNKPEGAKVPSDNELRKIGHAINNKQSLNIEMTGGHQQPTYAENTGAYKGVIKQGEETGKYRAEDIHDIGQQQLGLTKAIDNTDALIEDFSSPDFVSLRDTLPFFQDQQLKVLAHTGSPQQREMIGNIIGEIESFKAATVNQFKGQTLKREFEFADKLKPSENDTVYTALGKLRALKSLEQVAWQKNKLISQYMDKNHMNMADAVEKANKQVNIKAIREQVKSLTQPYMKIKNKKTGDTMYLTKSRAQILGFAR